MSPDTAAIQLAAWIQQNYRYASLDGLTHLKLQKLAFYCYGAAMADDADAALPGIVFEPWEHGPVQRSIYQTYRSFGSGPIAPARQTPVQLPSEIERPMRDALDVYGVLRPWSLRQQSHLEEVWIDARASARQTIDPDAMRSFFKRKLQAGRVEWPEYLLGGSSMRLDGVPIFAYRTLGELADTVRGWEVERHGGTRGTL